MNKKETIPEDCPQWLRPNANWDESPFHARTRHHLRERGAHDPRVFELITRLQDKDTQHNGEGRREREWARRICNNDRNVLVNLHNEYADRPADENDILRLAAYMGDTSYSYFFSQYASRILAGDVEGEERGRYNEAVQRIAPIVAELQPAVAIGFAPQIFEVYQHVGEPDAALKLFSDIARKMPYQVLAQEDRFADMSTVIATANEETKKPHVARSPSELRHAENVVARREIAERMKELGITRS